MVASVWGNGTPQEAFEVPPDSIISEQSGNYVILTSDAHKVIDYIGAGGHTFTLPDATLAGNGFMVYIRNSGGAAITVAPATVADTVNGAASTSLTPTATIQLMVKNTDFGILLAKNTGATAVSTAFTPAGSIAASNVQAAIEELDAEKAAVAGNAANVFRVATAVGNSDAIPLAQGVALFPSATGLISQLHTAFTTTGIDTAFVLTPTQVQTAYAAGMRFRVKFHLTAGVAPTINVSGLGVKALMLYNSLGAKVAAGATSIVANMLTDVEYDGTDFVILDSFPSPPTGTLIAFTKILATDAAWAPNAATKTLVVCCVGGGGAGGGIGSASANTSYGGQKGATIWGSSTSVSGTYAATIGAGGTGTLAGVGNAGGTTSFGALASATGGVGGGVGSVTSAIAPLSTGQSHQGAGGAVGTNSDGGAAAVNTGAGGGGAEGNTISDFTGGAGGSGIIYVWEFA